MKTIFLILLLFLIGFSDAVAYNERFAGGEGNVQNPQPFFDKLNKTIWNDKQDEPFLQIRQRLDKQFAQTKPSGSQLASYENIAKSSPTDATAQFRWAYAQFFRDTDRAHNRDNEIAEALSKPQRPRSYEYTRIQFLYEARGTYPHMLTPLARRLVKQDPQDKVVKRFASWVLTSGYGDKSVKIEAVRWSDELVALEPKNLDYLNLSALCREVAYYKTNDPKYARLAIDAYKRYAKIVMPSDEGYKPAVYMVGFLEKKLAEHKVK